MAVELEEPFIVQKRLWSPVYTHPGVTFFLDSYEKKVLVETDRGPDFRWEVDHCDVRAIVKNGICKVRRIEDLTPKELKMVEGLELQPGTNDFSEFEAIMGYEQLISEKIAPALMAAYHGIDDLEVARMLGFPKHHCPVYRVDEDGTVLAEFVYMQDKNLKFRLQKIAYEVQHAN